MAPPLGAVLSLKVLRVTVRVLKLRIAPPVAKKEPPVEFCSNEQPVTVSRAWGPFTTAPPPPVEELFTKAQSVRVNCPRLATPPAETYAPPRTVKPERVTTAA